MKKRWISFFCACAALMALIRPALAENASDVLSENRRLISDYDAIYDGMMDAIASGANTMNLFEYRINTGDFMKIYSDLFATAPEFFFLAPRVAYHTGDGVLSDTIVDVTFQYNMTREEREAASAFYEKEIEHIVSIVPKGLSEAETALYVHDYLIASFAYDESETVYDTYTFLRTRTGVCQAYSLVYLAVLRELGMEAAVITSAEMRHAWNLVKVDGTWYHVDLVYDDPRPDRTGRVLHEYFLLTDDEIRAKEHYGWSSSVKCTTPWPKNPLWQGATSRMIWLNGRWYYIDNDNRKLYSALYDKSDRQVLYSFQKRWMLSDSPNRYWVGTFSGLSEWNGILYVNTPTEIVYVDPATGENGVYLRSDGGDDIYGSAVVKNTLDYVTAGSPNLDGDQRVFSVAITGEARTGSALPFDDVDVTDAWYDAVKFVYDRGLFNGVSQTKFAPGATLTRAMFVTVLGRLCGVDPAAYAESSFSDVTPGLWYSAYVEWAAQTGIVNGVGGGLFDPLGELTKEQMMKIVAICGAKLGAGVQGSAEDLAGYEYRAGLHDWAQEGAAWCAANGLLASRTSLDPQSTATRAEAAAMIANFARLAGK